MTVKEFATEYSQSYEQSPYKFVNKQFRLAKTCMVYCIKLMIPINDYSPELFKRLFVYFANKHKVKSLHKVSPL
jgi:ribosomal protein L13